MEEMDKSREHGTASHRQGQVRTYVRTTMHFVRSVGAVILAITHEGSLNTAKHLAGKVSLSAKDPGKSGTWGAKGPWQDRGRHSGSLYSSHSVGLLSLYWVLLRVINPRAAPRTKLQFTFLLVLAWLLAFDLSTYLGLIPTALVLGHATITSWALLVH